MNAEEPSILSHINDVRSRYIPEGGISSVIFCGVVSSDAEVLSALQVHRKVVSEEVSGNITGIAFVQSTSLVHLLEGPSDSIIRILSKLSSHPHFRDGNQAGRIVYCVEDRPMRFFPGWYSTSIQERRSQAEDLTDESSKEAVHDLASGLLNVGKLISTESQEDVEFSRYGEHLPGKGLVVALANAAQFFTLEEYVDVFASPFHLDLESEHEWPLDRLVQY